MSDSSRPYNALDAKILSITQRKTPGTSSLAVRQVTEPHLRISADFLTKCAGVKLSKDSLLLYLYMLLRAAPVEAKRSKCAHLFGDVIRKGEFFEGKLRVAGALGKSHISDKSKINWFGKTVRPLVDLGLVKKLMSVGGGITQLISSMISAKRIGLSHRT